VDIGNKKVKEILRVRSPDLAYLSLARFLRRFTISNLFISECEVILGRTEASLKNIVNNHAEEYIRAYGDWQIQTLTMRMDIDIWQVKEFPVAENEILKTIIESGALNPPAWIKISNILAPLLPREAGRIHGTEEKGEDKTCGASING
jgi:hypothetical protein